MIKKKRKKRRKMKTRKRRKKMKTRKTRRKMKKMVFLDRKFVVLMMMMTHGSQNASW